MKGIAFGLSLSLAALCVPAWGETPRSMGIFVDPDSTTAQAAARDLVEDGGWRADRDAAAVVLATLDHPDPEYLHAAMVAVTAPQRLETVDFLTGTFPHGLDWAATEEAETVLNAAVAMGPREAAAGALAVLAYVAWLRGQGTQAADRLGQAAACTPGHAHVRAVSALTTATPVAAIAADRAHAWKPSRG